MLSLARIAVLSAAALLLAAATVAAASPAPLLTMRNVALEFAYARLPGVERWIADFDGGMWRSSGAEVTLESGLCLTRGQWSALLSGRGRWGEALPPRGRIDEAWVAWQGAHWGVRAGRGPLHWAPALEADLLISIHPRSLDQIRIDLQTAPLPRVGGRFFAEAFLGYLDDPQRAVPYPLLWGMRAAWAPREWIRLEAQRTILMGGAGRTERFTPRDIWEIFWGLGEGTGAAAAGPEHFSHRESDQKFAWQGILHPPSGGAWRLGMHDVEAFWIYAGEDRFYNLVPMAPARCGGIRVHPTPRLAASIIYGTTAPRKNRWYYHKAYTSGYTYRALSLGHPMGGDAKSWRVGFFAAPLSGTLWALRLAREKRGYHRGDRDIPPGSHWRWEMELSAPGPGGRISAGFGGARAWEADRGSERLTEGYAWLRISWRPAPRCVTLDRDFVWGSVRETNPLASSRGFP